MKRILKEISMEELMKKFGAGSHKPGSGSAAAVQGMLSAQLLNTVIKITSKKDEYQIWHDEFARIHHDINNRVYPELTKLFYLDSKIFDEVIELRRQRDNEEDKGLKKQLNLKSQRKLKPATETPIEIASLCIDLVNHAKRVFDHGFKHVRGDSGVALNGALSAIGGCISIIDLNLLSFKESIWSKNIIHKCNELKSVYKSSQDEINKRQNLLEREVQMKYLRAKIDNIILDLEIENHLSDSQIEKSVSQLQNALWTNRKLIWPNREIRSPIEILDPIAAIKLTGYKYQERTTLGYHQVQGGLFEIAGEINNSTKTVRVSGQFKPSIKNFTQAHELGHSMMHRHGLESYHRDRPKDGSAPPQIRDKEEYQADKFAVCFLMPRKLIKRHFQHLFLMSKFIITEETAFALTGYTPSELRKNCSDLFGLCLLLSTTTFFNGKSFSSLSETFGVSPGAMAIRLEELKLVGF